MKYILNIFSFLCILTLVAACDKFTDIHQDFIKDGEIIYAVKPDSVVFIAGKERLMMRLWMENAHNVKQVVVSWNSGQDSLVVPVTFKTGRDSIEVLLNGLEEKSYSFNIYSVDNFGNRSLTYTQFGSAFGSTYAEFLGNRRVKKTTLTEREGVIDWFAPAEGMIINEVTFTSRQGNDTLVRIPSTAFSVAINAGAGATFRYRSLYIPQEESIDTFYTAWSSDKLPDTYVLDRVDWEAIAVSDEKASDGGGKAALVDGNLGTFWHSQWGPDIALPHWAIIDMATVKNIVYFSVYRRPGNTDAKTVRIYLGNSSDPDTGWALAGEGTFTSGDMVNVTNSNNAAGRYLKIYLPDSNRPPFTSIAEVYGYGK
jgi:hypothetical protein